MTTLDHLGPFSALLLELERRLKEVDVELPPLEAAHHVRRVEAIEAAVAHQATHNGTILLLDEGLTVLVVGTRARHPELRLAHRGAKTSFMNLLSLSKSTPRRSQRNRLCAGFIASTTSEPSRLNNGRHSVQPVANRPSSWSG